MRVARGGRRIGEVSTPAGQHSLPTLAISASLAGPLLHVAGLESGGIHLFGNSSTGKTTLLKLAASVWGDGGLVHSWRATSNGLEGIANRTSDVALILDELGQLETREAATSLYMLASGAGKVRMNRNATLQDIKTWRARDRRGGSPCGPTWRRGSGTGTATTPRAGMKIRWTTQSGAVDDDLPLKGAASFAVGCALLKQWGCS
jgi:hypothetical protein